MPGLTGRTIIVSTGSTAPRTNVFHRTLIKLQDRCDSPNHGDKKRVMTLLHGELAGFGTLRLK